MKAASQINGEINSAIFSVSVHLLPAPWKPKTRISSPQKGDESSPSLQIIKGPSVPLNHPLAKANF